MRVSIITPSFNQASYLERTILSVLNQSYRAIEYILIDGGSTDGSLEIIKKHQNRFAYSQSRKDGGQWDAVNQGLKKATGDILYWLNSDDLLMSDAVERVVQSFQQNPQTGIVYGKAKFIDSEGNYIHDYPSREFDLKHVLCTWENPIPQPSAFLRRDVFEKYGGTDETLFFCADFEYWIRISSEVKFLYLQEYLSGMRIHPDTKTSRKEGVQAQELIQLCERIIKSERFKTSGVDAKHALQGVYFRSSMHFRHAGEKQKALQSYFRFCKRAFSPPVALYRFCRFLAGMILHRW